MERIRLKLKKLQSRDIIKENNEKNSKEGENLLTKENLDNIDTDLPIIKKSNELLDKSSNRSFLICSFNLFGNFWVLIFKSAIKSKYKISLSESSFERLYKYSESLNNM